MKILFLVLSFFNIWFLLAQEETLEDFFKMSQENLKKYSLAELTGLDPIKNEESLEFLSENIKTIPKRYLFLNNLSMLSLAQVKTLIQFDGIWLSLNGLKQLDENTAKALSQFQCKGLSLEGLKQIDEATLKILSQFNKEGLSLDGLQQINEIEVIWLSQFKCKNLYLNAHCNRFWGGVEF